MQHPRSRRAAFLVAFGLSTALGCSASPDEEDTAATADELSSGWNDAAELHRRELGAFSPQAVTLPTRAELPGDACGPGCASLKSSIITCPGVSYPNVRGFRKDGAFRRETNGSETGDELGLHLGMFFYTCDDFCGDRAGACAPGQNRENEYGIKVNVATNKFAFYQSYDSNSCGARHRVDSLNGNFDPTLSDTTYFAVEVLPATASPPAGYIVKQVRKSDGSIYPPGAKQTITNCTFANDCEVECAGSKPGMLKAGCDQSRSKCDASHSAADCCPVDCTAKHRDNVSLYGASGKLSLHTMKKEGPAYIYWSKPGPTGKPSSVETGAHVQVRSSGPAVGRCTLPDPQEAAADPVAWDLEN